MFTSLAASPFVVVSHFLAVFDEELRKSLKQKLKHAQPLSPEQEHAFLQSSLIQLALFDRYLEQQLRRKRVRRTPLSEEERSNEFGRWAKKYGQHFEELLQKYRADWFQRFEQCEPSANVLLRPLATPAEHRAKRLAQVELDTLLYEIEALL